MLESTDALGRPINPRNLGIRNSFMVGLLKAGHRSPAGDSEKRKKRRKKRASPFGGGGGPTTPYDPVKELSEFGLYSQQMCQRHALYVSFRDLNWEVQYEIFFLG